MLLKELRTNNFRNLSNDNCLNFNYKNIFFIGKNGQGKSNLLEAIYMLMRGSSFRTRLNRELIRHGENKGFVYGSFYDDFGLRRTIGVSIEKNQRSIKLDSKNIKDRAILFDEFPSVIFSHDDMEIVEGSIEKRRRFLNQTLALCDPPFIGNLRRYYRILKSRNIAVRERNERLLTIYDDKLVEEGLQIQKKRIKFIKDFNSKFNKIIGEISEELNNTMILYAPSWDEERSIEEIKEEIVSKREREYMLGYTTSGPHKDNFIFKAGNLRFSSFASTGQKRLCSLSLKVTQAILIYEFREKKPILLLDDVLLEMDRERRMNFIKYLPPYSQSFFTFLPEENFLSYIKNDVEMYNVDRGNLSRL